MKTTKKLSIGILILTVMLSVTLVALPNKFSSFQGNIKVNGANAQVGREVAACIGEIEGGRSVIYAASGKTWYVMDVTNGSNGDEITFRVDGLLANEIGIYNDLVEYINQNLTVNQSSYTLNLVEGWNLISIPLELKYDKCISILQ